MNTILPSPFVILLVEDEPADAYLVRMALAENHILTDLHHVADGIEAFDFLHKRGDRYAKAPAPDLILLDLNMPRMNGREFLAAIKHHEHLKAIPVVVMTTSEVEQDILASYKLGAAGFIVKPLDVTQFMQAIRKLEDYWCTVVRIPKWGCGVPLHL